jgi:predicted transcriptional regulator of viral defense system
MNVKKVVRHMSYGEQLDNLIEKNNGLVLTRDANEWHIPRTYLSEFTQKNRLQKVAHGVYLSPDAFDDEMYRLQARCGQAVFSHETALYIHDLTDRDPVHYTVTVPSGYNTSNLKASGTTVFTIKKELHRVGTTTAKTPCGRDITVYDADRTICDILRSRNKIDTALLNDAMKRYLGSKHKNVPQLLRYAKLFGIESVARRYLEVLL